jgi:hypothetical protein
LIGRSPGLVSSYTQVAGCCRQAAQWGYAVQTAQPRDLGPLALAIGLLLILLIVVLTVGAAPIL